MPNVVKWES